MSHPATAAPDSITQDRPAEPPPARGWLVMLFTVIGVPALVVPILLAGTSLDREVDLRNLMQRERSAFRVGGIAVARHDDRLLDEWPTPEAHPYIRGELNTPTRSTPSAFARDLFGEVPPPEWTTTLRGLPFAIFARIDNPRVMNDNARAVVELRLVAASVFDPADADDRAALLALDEALSVKTPSTGEAPAKRKRRMAAYTPPTMGEQLAKQLLDAILELPPGPGRKAAAREILRKPAPSI